MTNRLFALLNDPLSPLLKKGETTERYYNPGDIFDEVHVVLCNDDQPDLEQLHPMVGGARLFLHNLPTPPRFFWRTLGWQEGLMGDWLEGARQLALDIQPDLVRCYGAHVNATAGRIMGKCSGVPTLVSLHNRPDAPPEGLSLQDRFRHEALSRLAIRELKAADMVFAVYKSQLSYLKRVGVSRAELAYNVLNSGDLRAKENYKVSGFVKILSVGRLIPGKNPENLIRAVAKIDNVSLTLVGDGPLREGLEKLVANLKVSERISFLSSMNNDLLCRSLHQYDIFAGHNDYPGIPKAVMEPLLCGMPVLLNHAKKEVIPELTEEICFLTDNTQEGYESALKELIEDDYLRETLGRSARAYAQDTWDPVSAEARYADIYRNVMQ